jgi:hypothetical protein
MSDMKKTPSYLKGLAETRARVAADVQRYQQLHDEIGQTLDKAKAELAACDMLIRKFDERLNPELIEPIKAWKGRYGKRGARKEAILEVLKARAPGFVTTTEIAWTLQIRFQLDFFSWQEKDSWINNSVAKFLRNLAKEGVVERLHDPAANTGEVGRWCWIGEGCEALADLTALAESSGITPPHSSSEHYEPEEEPATDDLPV